MVLKREIFAVFMRIVVMSVCFILPGVASGDEEAVNLTLEDCLDLGIRSNPGLRAANFMVDEAEADIRAARSDFLPSLSAGTAWSKINSIDTSGRSDQDYLDQKGFNYNARASQPLYSGGRRFNAYKRAKNLRDMHAADKNYTEAELRYQIKIGFFKLMKAREDVRVSVDNVKRLEADSEAARAFYEKQMTSYAHVLQAKVDLADARQELSILRNTVDRRRTDLFVLMNQPFSPDVEFSGELDYYASGVTMPAAEYFKRAVEKRSDLKSLAHQIAMAEKDAAISLGKYLPDVSLNAGYYDDDKNYKHRTELNENLDRRNEYWTASVNASWNLFDGGRAWHEKSRYRIQIQRLKSRINEVESRVKGGITSALFSLSEAEDRIEATKEAIDASREYYERESRRFQAGIATVVSVLDAQVRVKRAEGNHNQALLDYQLARAELDFLTGEDNR